MCGLRATKSAVVISPLLPEPPVTGGQKRTLRLLEAMERSGLTPHILTADLGATERLRERGWVVEVAARAAAGPARPRAPASGSGCRARMLRGVGARFAQLAPSAALVQFEHTQSAYYAVPEGVPSVLSLHNIDSAIAQPFVRSSAFRAVERRAYPRMDRVLCVSEADAAAVRAGGGHALLAPNGVDDAFFDVTGPGEGALFFGAMDYGRTAAGSSASSPRGGPSSSGRFPERACRLRGPGASGSRAGSASSRTCPPWSPRRGRSSSRSGRAAARA